MMPRLIVVMLLFVVSNSLWGQDKTTIDTKHLLGAWWDVTDKSSPHPTFHIDSASIRYPDEHEHDHGDHAEPEELIYKYQVQDDVLVIYFGRFNDTSQIMKLTQSEMELKRGDQKLAFIKKEK